MPLQDLGAILLLLVVILVIGNLWFHFVEGVLGWFRRLTCRKDPPAWHPLPPDGEDDQDAKK